MPGIQKYKPNFFQEAGAFNKVHGNTLSALIGKSIDDYWLMWKTKEDEWLSDGPVILKINNRQFEFTVYQLSDFSLTIDQIDLDQQPDWYGAGDEIPLTWKSHSSSDIDKILGLPIREINLLTFRLVATGIDGNKHESDFMLTGIQFDFNDRGQKRYLQIFNEVDQNGLSSKPYEEDYQRKKIGVTPE
jgi:hypothetical protein